MSDDTRTDGDHAPGHESDRTSSEVWSDRVWPADLGEQIDSLRRTGGEVLALALPWAKAVTNMLSHFEHALAPLHLDDDLHRRVGQAAGIAELYDMLDTLSWAASEVG